MRLFKTKAGALIETNGGLYRTHTDWDSLVCSEDLHQRLQEEIARPGIAKLAAPLPGDLLAPVGRQEVWAAGVTYWRSRSARMEESQNSGGSTFYDKVYEAERPELFFKAAPFRVTGPGQPVRIRRDSAWNVPEPELTLLLSPKGRIEAYTIGNDMSSRDIEGENPLYLPQAKCYDGSCAIGPCLYVSPAPLPETTEIVLEISRGGKTVFGGSVGITQIRRKFEELAAFLFREMSFPHGCLLMTGTGIVPPNDFTLQAGDEVRIQIEPIGSLINRVEL